MIENNAEQTRARAGLEKAAHYLEIGRPEKAEEELRRLLALYPEQTPLHQNLAIALIRQEHFDEAEEEIRVALQTDPDDAFGYYLMGSIRMDQGRNREAEEHLLKALHLEPAEPRYYIRYGHLMFKTNRLEKAEKLVRHALTLDPEDSSAHSMLSMILSDRKKGQASIRHGEKGLSLRPDEHIPHLALGINYLQTGRPFKARHHLREALRLDPTDEDIREACEAADRATRIIFLPMYYWSLLLDRIPGKQFSVWIAAIVATYLLRAGGFEVAAACLMIPYILFVLYTWVSFPLVSFWIKLRPMK